MPRRAPTQSQLRVLGLLYNVKPKSARTLHALTTIISSLLEMGLIARNNGSTYKITRRGNVVYERSPEMYKSRREPKKRVNVTMSPAVRIEADRAAAEMGVSRSTFITLAVLDEIRSNPSPTPEAVAPELQQRCAAALAC